MRLTLTRMASANGATVGTLTDAQGEHLCYTLEDVVREVTGQPVLAWKIRGQTAIPRGTYRVTFVNSARFGPGTLNLCDVPGFEAIRMHSGNTVQDTEGFIPMMELIDREKELARLNKEKAKAEKEMAMFGNQLNNPKFVERAPAALVEEIRTKFAKSQDKLANIEQSIKALG